MTSLADEMVSVTRNLRPRTPKSEISSAGEFVYARIDGIDNIRKFTCYHINQLQAPTWKWAFLWEVFFGNISRKVFLSYPFAICALAIHLETSTFVFFQKKNRDDNDVKNRGREEKIRKPSNVSVTHLLISFRKPKRILRELQYKAEILDNGDRSSKEPCTTCSKYPNNGIIFGNR